KSKWKDISHLAMLLTTPLLSLKRKGYPVDRILASYKIPVRVADKYEPPKSSARLVEKTSSSNSPLEIEKLVKQLQDTYPDCDPAFIHQLLVKEKFDMNKVANNLADTNYPKISKTPLHGSNNNDGDDGSKNNGWNLLEKMKSISNYVTSPNGVSGQVPVQPQQVVESKSSVGELPPITKPIEVNPRTTKNLHNALREAVKSSRSNSGSVIDSQATVKVVTESQTSYCDVLPGHSLIYIGINNEIELYIAKGLDPSEITSGARSKSLTRFVNILRDLCEVFELQPKAVHIFYDNNSNSIAFNRGRALFFNFRFYLGLHNDEDSDVTSSETLTYWYMTFCHELAHNFIAPHNSEHEYYFSSFAESYMTNFLIKMKKLGII
ncbi:12269_t:CDS:2, partial [Acaulospora morrowiae]